MPTLCPPARIKDAILHVDLEIRSLAVRYFAKSNLRDASIMPQVIQAVEAYDKEDAYHLLGAARELPQSDATIAWVIDELNAEQSDQYESYTFNLSMILVAADVTLLLPHASSILEARHLFAESRVAIAERLEIAEWDEPTCWNKLEDFCREYEDASFDDVDLSHANRIVEAIARFGMNCEARVQEVLTQRNPDTNDHSMRWMEPLMLRLAGLARLESTVPMLVAKFLEDASDLNNQECIDALCGIATPAVLQAIEAAYPDVPRELRVMALKPLETIRSELAVEVCLRLLPQETDEYTRISIAYAMLNQFAHEAIEPTRQLLVGEDLGFEGGGLREELLETCEIMGVTFPEFEQWKSDSEREQEEHQLRIDQLHDDPTALMIYALEKLMGKEKLESMKAARTSQMARQPASPIPIASPLIESRQRTGRNEKCPCGSGKKFKHCCSRK